MYVLAILGSYLAGSVPFGYLIARAKGVDIRGQGSGNIGATNVGRILGKAYGILVFVLDFLKGFGPVLAARLVGHHLGDSAFVQHDLPVLCGLGAVLGHVFPVWLRFRGGKAGATGLGVGAALMWQAMLVAAVIWGIVVAISRYVSLGTILACIAYVIAYLGWSLFYASPWDREHITMTVFCVLVTSLVVLRHKTNIQRLLAGTENRI